MRGKRTAYEIQKGVGGITPAHAGKTRSHRKAPRSSRDHPRACGENPFILPGGEAFPGSPPRMRGKLFVWEEGEARAGITPAHAGKTAALHASTMLWRDHPRACGENSGMDVALMMTQGSPPRMRGKPLLADFLPDLFGITPAHAGKTARKRRRVACGRDHPRACGENYNKAVGYHIKQGSPPRMRGKLRNQLRIEADSGITPAHAGKTLRKGRISVVDPSPQPRSSLTSRRADASIGSQRAPCAAPV